MQPAGNWWLVTHFIYPSNGAKHFGSQAHSCLAYTGEYDNLGFELLPYLISDCALAISPTLKTKDQLTWLRTPGVRPPLRTSVGIPPPHEGGGSSGIGVTHSAALSAAATWTVSYNQRYSGGQRSGIWLYLPDPGFFDVQQPFNACEIFPRQSWSDSGRRRWKVLVLFDERMQAQ